MVRRDPFSHTSLSEASFVDRIRRSGYLSGASAWMVGENLAWPAGSRSTPGKTVRAWMRSAGHDRSMLSMTEVPAPAPPEQPTPSPPDAPQPDPKGPETPQDD